PVIFAAYLFMAIRHQLSCAISYINVLCNLQDPSFFYLSSLHPQGFEAYALHTLNIANNFIAHSWINLALLNVSIKKKCSSPFLIGVSMHMILPWNQKRKVLSNCRNI